MTTRARRRWPRVLLMAEAANPEWSSVPLVGWNLYRALANVTDAHLVTHVRNRDAIIRAGMTEGLDFTIVDNERYAAPLYKLSERLRGGIGKGWTTVTAVSSLAYYSYEREMWRQFRDRLMAHEFNLVHRITPLSPTSQSIVAKRLARLKIPFVIGPLNGGVPWPRNFRERQHAERDWLSHVRGLYRFLPGYRSTRRYSSAIIAGSKHTLEEMPRWARDRCVYIPENGVSSDSLALLPYRCRSYPLRGAFVGRLVPYKGADILLEASVEFLRKGQLELHIIGDGPQKESLSAMVEQFQLHSSVCFHGWVPHAEVQEKLRKCDFMVLPSIREFGGGVVVEAMALGVTPIVADYAGPAELVDDETGIRVPFHDTTSLVQGIGQAIGKAIVSPQMLDTLGAAARRKVGEKLTWEAKADQIVSVYEAALSGKKNLNFLDWH